MKKLDFPLKIGDKIEVRWIDTFSYNGWYSTEELIEKTKEGEEMMITAGIFAGEQGSFIIVCGIYCPTKVLSHSPFGHPNWIPKGSIKGLKKLIRQNEKIQN